MSLRMTLACLLLLVAVGSRTTNAATPARANAASRRDKWDAARKNFREKWAEELGRWPAQPDGTSWPGHHIRDLRYGGDPVAENNVLPVRPDVHDSFSKEYPRCYSGNSQWSTAGINRPYDD
jgi:hypothetical protein